MCDVYTLMFIIDVVNFIVIIFGYWAFGVSTYGVGERRKDMSPILLKYCPPLYSPLLTCVLSSPQKHSASADITESLSEDQVPEAFLVMLLIQFGTMIVDRALYLKKTLMGKCVFQVGLVFGIHFWMFFILPGVTERSEFSN